VSPSPRTSRAAPRRTERTIPKPSTDPVREETRRLLREYAAKRDPAIRDALVERNTDLVHYIARRFANRGEPLEDIEQVGFLGLINAVERFDPGLENEFSTFATPTIMGEIRRHFRDRSWAVRVPRRLQENFLRVTRAREDLTAALGRQPTIAEISERVELQPDEVLAALEVAPAQRAVSLEAPAAGPRGEGTQQEVGDRIGLEDANLERVEMKQILGQAMRHLTEREREIVALRFIEQLPQTEVAKRLGISQMHVSRLQRAAVEQMRQDLAEPSQA